MLVRLLSTQTSRCSDHIWSEFPLNSVGGGLLLCSLGLLGERERAHVLKATPDEKTRCEPWPGPKNGGGADGPKGPRTLDDVDFCGVKALLR